MMTFEETEVRLDGQLTHVNDLVETDRLEARRRLEFISAKLGSSALQDVKLGGDFDAMSQSDFDLAA